MNGLYRVGPAVMVSGHTARILRDALLIAARARSINGLPVSRDYQTIAAELHAAMSASGHPDVRAPAVADAGVMSPDVPIEQAAAELGCSKRQARRLAPSLGGRIVGGRWLIDRQALNEHIEGRDKHGSTR